jgi:hypothetical protein
VRAVAVLPIPPEPRMANLTGLVVSRRETASATNFSLPKNISGAGGGVDDTCKLEDFSVLIDRHLADELAYISIAGEVIVTTWGDIRFNKKRQSDNTDCKLPIDLIDTKMNTNSSINLDNVKPRVWLIYVKGN